MEALIFFNRILQEVFENDSDSNDDEFDEDNPPPLVPKQPTEVSTAEDSSTFHNDVGIEKHKTPPLYYTSSLCFDDEDDNVDDDVPPLVNVKTGEILQDTTKKEEVVPIVYKKLIAQGETVEIAEHLIKEIPYIDTLFSGRFTVNEEEGIVKTEEINPHLLKVILKYLESKKLYKLLACLPKNHHVYELFELMHFLAIQIPIKTSLKDIKEKLEDSQAVDSQKDLVEFALAIFHAYHQLDYRKTHRKARDNVFNIMRSIFKSDSQSYKPRAKFHLLRLAKKCVLFTFNQFQHIRKLKVTENLDKSDTESIGIDPSEWLDYDDYDDYFYDSDEPWMDYYHHHHLFDNDFYDDFDVWNHYHDGSSDFSDY